MARLLICCVLACVASSAAATVFNATNLNDSGPGSVREAVAQANASPESDIVVSIGAVGMLNLTSGPIYVTRAVKIMGPGIFNLTIDGGGNGRIFNIVDPSPVPCPGPTAAADFFVIIVGMSLTNGYATDGRPGGAIYSDHSLYVDNVRITNSAANQGGGIALNTQYSGQYLVVTNSYIEGNVAMTTGGNPGTAYSGGGIHAGPRCALDNVPPVAPTPLFHLWMADSEVCGNSVVLGTRWGLGGGISVLGGGDLQVIDSKISGNFVKLPETPGNYVGFGGNIFGLGVRNALFRGSEISAGRAVKGGGADFENFIPSNGSLPDSSVHFVNSTISGNKVNGTGANGGAASFYGKVDVYFDNSTLFRNRNLAGGVAGVYLDTGGNVPSPTTAFRSTINYSDGEAYDIGANLALIPGYMVMASNSLFGKIPAYGSLVGDGNLLEQNPMLGLRLSYGGSATRARSHPVLPGSPVIDAGSNPLDLEYDLRGNPFRRVIGFAPDMGAFEGLVNIGLQGVHWGAPAGSRSGEGWFFNQQGANGESVFGAGYLYAPFIYPLWLGFAAQRDAEGHYVGDAYTGTGPSLFDFDPSKVMPVKVGQVMLKGIGSGDVRAVISLQLPYSSAQAGADRPEAKAVLEVEKTLTLTRQVFGYPIPTCGPGTPEEQAAATNYQDVWWAYPPDSEPGWGLMIAHQGNTLFVAWFTYGEDGQPLWLVFSAQETAPNVFAGTIYTATGPSFGDEEFDPSKVAGTVVGTATLTFANGSRGRFDYTVNGVSQSKEIVRQLFAAVGNVCQ